MPETPEPLAAVLAEMRDERIVRLDGADTTRCLLLNLADRIEAAAERERDRLRDVVRKTLQAIDALYAVAAPGAIVKEITPDRTCLGTPIGKIVAEASAAIG